MQLSHKQRFGVVQFSVQGNHLHMIVEAEDEQVLSRGMQGLQIRLAKRLNTLFGRRGKLFRERYHAQPLRSPKQVRGALAYVLNNRRRQLAASGKRLRTGYLDPFSSAPHFQGWSGRTGTDPHLAGESVTVEPKTWLLRVGWKRHGPLQVDAIPGPR